MENKHYSFKAKFNEVDFPRIVQEAYGDGYDFVKVKWTNEEGRDQCCHFATQSGYARARKVDMGRMYFSTSRCKIVSSGEFEQEGHPKIYKDLLHIFQSSQCSWREFISKLREREERDRQINVVQIR